MKVTVLLSQGNVQMLHPSDGTAVRVKAGEIPSLRVTGFKTLGEVAMLNGSVVVTAKEGALQVEESWRHQNVARDRPLLSSPRPLTIRVAVARAWGQYRHTTLEVAAVGAGGIGGGSGGRIDEPGGKANTNALAATQRGQRGNLCLPTQPIQRRRRQRHQRQQQQPQRHKPAFLAACANDLLRQNNTASVNALGGSQCPTYNPGTTPSLLIG